MSEAVYQHMAEMTILVTQLVVEFAKKLPGFSDLAREDQINVLKVRIVTQCACYQCSTNS